MEFSDLTPQREVTVPSPELPIEDVGEYHDAELANFMSRPIRIAQITWTYAATINGVINPWLLFFSDARVKNRIAYYNLMKCNLCVKFLVNGNAFQYGQLFIDYLPLETAVVGQATLNDSFSFTDTTKSIYPNAQTHRQYMKIRPLDSEGGCMKLPFFWPNNWMSIPFEEWQYMGRLRYYAVNPVLHANNASATDPPVISVFAWAEDFKLSVPTAKPPATLPGQMALEYLPMSGKAPSKGGSQAKGSSKGDSEVIGAVSGPASALAGIAGSMANLPIVGPYARATQMAASGIGSVAKMFGYSRPPVETPCTLMKPDFTGNIAQTDRPENINKLTFDSSQEVAISSAIMGIDNGDELAISKIAGKETYLTQFTWNFTQGADTSLFHIHVTPLLYALHPTYTVTRAVYPTALAYASAPFTYWRGSLKFRFEVICSKFHRGRIRIMYDPASVPTVGDFNKNYQEVLDLDSNTDLEVTVNWGIPEIAALVGGTSFSSVPYGPIFSNPGVNDNGALYLYVLNNLSVPNQGLAGADCLVYVNVYVSAGDDYEVAVPNNFNLNGTSVTVPFTPASGLEYLPMSGTEDMGPKQWVIGSPATLTGQDLQVWGESLVTFRALLKRYVDYFSDVVNVPVATNSYQVTMNKRRIPLFPGNDTGGVNTVTNLQTTGTFPGNYIYLSLLAYLMPAFAGMRGSFRYKYVIQAGGTGGQQPITIYSATRNAFTVQTAPLYTSNGVVLLTNDALQKAYRSSPNTWQGTALVNSNRNPILEIEDPYYERFKFQNPRFYGNNVSTAPCSGHIINTPHIGQTGTNFPQYIYSYVATGEDFNLAYYTGPPVLWASAYY